MQEAGRLAYFDDVALPYTRKVTTYLMRATSELVTRIEQSRLDEYERDDGTTEPLSWNLCDALLRVSSEREASQLPTRENDGRRHGGHASRWPAHAPTATSKQLSAVTAIFVELFAAESLDLVADPGVEDGLGASGDVGGGR